MQKKGIDVSEFQDIWSYQRVKESGIDFAMIRAGFGFCTIDAAFHKNINGFRDAGIPYGLYWFSYAMSPDDARKEAEFFCDLADKYAVPALPLYFDWEYASDDYARRHGVNVTAQLLRQMAATFVDVCYDRGYAPGIYCNPDFIARYYGSDSWIRNIGASLWLANWSSDPGYTCDIWQYSEKGSVDGITGTVDLDIGYMEMDDGSDSVLTVEDCILSLTEKYEDICLDIMKGKYGSGDERKEKLGKYYDVAQEIINQAYLRKDGLF